MKGKYIIRVWNLVRHQEGILLTKVILFVFMCPLLWGNSIPSIQVYSGSDNSSGMATTPSQSVTFNPILNQQSDSMFQAPYQPPQQQAPPPGQHYSYFQGPPPTSYPYQGPVPVPYGSAPQSAPPYSQQMSSPAISASTSYGEIMCVRIQGNLHIKFLLTVFCGLEI